MVIKLKIYKRRKDANLLEDNGCKPLTLGDRRRRVFRNYKNIQVGFSFVCEDDPYDFLIYKRT